MTGRAARLSLAFSSLGHFYIHLFTAFYGVIVLQLEVEWAMSYDDLVELWWIGSLLVGLAALPAGRLGDMWSAPGMMVVYFIGMGAAAVACGLVSGPAPLALGLAGIGLFAAIYHPIGIPWMIRNATGNAGRMLAVNGIFGSLGAAAAGLLAGLLIDLQGWRAAFILPGLVSLATGFAMLWFLLRGELAEPPAPAAAEEGAASAHGAGRSAMLRIFLILLAAMFAGGLIYHGTQIALPKLFTLRLADLVGEGATGVGALVAAVYVVGGVTQLLGGWLADRYPLKTIYIAAWSCEMLMLVLLAGMAGLGVVGIAMLAVMMNLAQLPAENMLLARYAPRRHHGLAFGIKFVLAFGAAPVAILLVSAVWSATGGFGALFAGLGAAALVIVGLAALLPSERPRAPAAAPGE